MPRVKITGLPRNEVGDSLKKVRITKVPKASKAQAGKGLPVTKGLPDNMKKYANVEAEGGEVYQNKSGGFVKIDDKAPDHEQGGVMIPDAQRVLEDTSTKRKDKHSKRLKMSPDEVETIFGFKPKKPLSHAETFEYATAQYGNEVDKYNRKLKNTNDEGTVDKFSANTVRLNMLNRDVVPSKKDVFNTLFEHQEAIKAVHQIPDDGSTKYGGFKPKVQTGGDAIDLGLYRGPKNKANLYTPTGKTSEAKVTDKQIVDAYKSVGVDFGNARGADLQDKMYNYLIENEPDVLKATLKEYGPNQKALKAGKGKLKAFSDPQNATKEDLKAALPYLKDAFVGARVPLPSVQTNQAQGQPAPASQPAPFVPKTGNPNVNTNTSFKSQPKNGFHEDTHWYDIAPAAAEFVDSLSRDAELYNPIQLHQLKYKLMNPSAALYANQGDFNAALQSQNNNPLGSGVAAANTANLTAQKYKANAQVLANYENQNVATQNREIDYNTNVRDRQSMADAQSRATFYGNVLQSRDNQRLQKLQAIQDLSRVQQLKARQNNSGNLVEKLSPAFDQHGEYNGYQYIPVLPPEMGYPQPSGTSKPKSKTSQTTTYKIGDRVIKTTTND